MSALGDLLTECTAGLTSVLFGESGASAWQRAADVEAQQQAEGFVELDFDAVEGCVWHPAKPELETGDARRRVVLSGTLLVPTALNLTLSEKDRWQDAADVLWKPQTISDPIHGFRHVVLTKEARQFSGSTKKRG